MKTFENFLDRLARVSDAIGEITPDGRSAYFGDTGLYLRFYKKGNDCQAGFMPGGSGIEARNRAEAAYYAGKLRIGFGALHEKFRNGLNLPEWFNLTDDSKLIFTTRANFASVLVKLFSTYGHVDLVTQENASVMNKVQWYNVLIPFKKFVELPDNDPLILFCNALRHGKLVILASKAGP